MEQEAYTPEDVQRLQALAQMLGDAAGIAPADASADVPQTDEALAAHLDALEANMDAFEGAFREANPAVKSLLASAISLPTSQPAHGCAPEGAGVTPPRSPLSFVARPPLPPPGSLDSTSTHQDSDSFRAQGPASAPTSTAAAALPPVAPGLPPSGLRLGTANGILQRSAFASPRGTASPILAGSIGGTTPRGGLSSPHGHPGLPPAPPPSMTYETSPRRDLLFPALTPTNSLTGPGADRSWLSDSATSTAASPVHTYARREAQLAVQLRHRLNAMGSASHPVLHDTLLQMSINQGLADRA